MPTTGATRANAGAARAAHNAAAKKDIDRAAKAAQQLQADHEESKKMLAALRKRAEYHGFVIRSESIRRDLATRKWTADPTAAAVKVQRIWRGVLGRSFAAFEQRAQRFAACVIQATWKRSKVRKAMALRIQRASQRRVARREANSIFQAARQAAQWRWYAAQPETREYAATKLQAWSRGQHDRALVAERRDQAARVREEKERIATLVSRGYPAEADETATVIQAYTRSKLARARVMARRAALRDIAKWREERAQKSAEALDHERQVVEDKKAAAQLEELKREAYSQLRSHVPPDQRCQVEKKIGRGGRVFRFKHPIGIPVVDLGSPDIGLLPEPTDVDSERMDEPIEAPIDEHDGCVVEIWTWIHSKHPVSSEGCPHVRLPDTIVYKYRQPCTWYFSDRLGNLRRKKREKVNTNEIYRCFTRADSSSPASEDSIVALYTYSRPTKPEAPKPGQQGNRKARETVVEHLTASQLKDFLMFRDVVHDGQLQRYIPPKRGENATFVAVWSPHTLLLEKWVNETDPASASSSVYAKTVTHEAEPYSASMKPIRGDRFPLEVQRICRSIVEHTAAVSLRRICITRLSLTLRLDAMGQLWVSTCTSLRFNSSTSAPQKGPAGEGALFGMEEEAEEVSAGSLMGLAAASSAASLQPGTPHRSRPQSAASTPGRQQQRPGSGGFSRGWSSPTPSLSQSEPARPQSAGNMSSILGSQTPINVAHRFRPAPGINPQLHAKWDPGANAEEACRCVGCNRAYVRGTSVALSYHVLLGSHMREVGFFGGRVPKLIADKHPQLSYQQFMKLVRARDAGFLSRTVRVCQPCWIAHVAKGAPALHSGGAPRAASMATLQQQQQQQRAQGAPQRLKILKVSQSAAAIDAHRPPPQRSAAAPTPKGSASVGALPAEASSRSRTGPTSWAARDLIYLIGHERRAGDRKSFGSHSEFIVPQISEWAATEIAERGVNTGTGRGGLSEQKVLELYDHMGNLSQMSGSKDMKSLLTILKS